MQAKRDCNYVIAEGAKSADPWEGKHSTRNQSKQQRVTFTKWSGSRASTSAWLSLFPPARSGCFLTEKPADEATRVAVISRSPSATGGSCFKHDMHVRVQRKKEESMKAKRKRVVRGEKHWPPVANASAIPESTAKGDSVGLISLLPYFFKYHVPLTSRE